MVEYLMVEYLMDSWTGQPGCGVLTKPARLTLVGFLLYYCFTKSVFCTYVRVNPNGCLAVPQPRGFGSLCFFCSFRCRYINCISKPVHLQNWRYRSQSRGTFLHPGSAEIHAFDRLIVRVIVDATHRAIDLAIGRFRQSAFVSDI